MNPDHIWHKTKKYNELLVACIIILEKLEQAWLHRVQVLEKQLLVTARYNLLDQRTGALLDKVQRLKAKWNKRK